MKHKCIIAKQFPGLGPPGKLDIEDVQNALEYAAELADHANS